MQDLAESSAVHGAKYIFDPAYSKLTKFLWILIILCSFGGLGYYIRSAYVKLYISPDISITTRDRKVEDFPHPAVTVCTTIFANERKANLVKFLNPKENETNYTKSECLYSASNSHWCFALNFDIIKQRCQEYIEEINGISPLELMVESLADIRVEDTENPKKSSKTLMDQGICFSSNMQDIDNIFTSEIHDDFRGFYQSYDKSFEWTPERGYFSENSTYPQRLKFDDGFHRYILVNRSDIENGCLIKKIFIYFHLPNEIPTIYLEARDLAFINFDEGILINLGVKSYRMEHDLKDFPIELRKCYFENERKLKFFKFYSLNHCKLECLSNITLAEFGCVQFHMPRDKETNICKLSEIHNFLTYKRDLNDCKCLPLCNDIKYSYITERIKIQPSSILNGEKLLKLLSWSDIQISYQEESVEEVEKFLGYKLQNFISDVGGLLGLFLGCSLISVIELFYLITQAFLKALTPFLKKTYSDDSKLDSEMSKKVHDLEKLIEERSRELRFEMEKMKKNLEVKIEKPDVISL